MILWLHYFHTYKCFSHISTILSLFFYSTVTGLSWHVHCYLISKNLYSLPNAQLFIFQFICMQLYKCLNCFLKTHNKQLNQYCLYFILFFYQKKVLKNSLGWPTKNTSQVTGHLVFASGQKNQVWIWYFSDRIVSG